MHIESKDNSDDLGQNHTTSVPSTSNSHDNLEHIDTTDVFEHHNDNTDIVEHIDELVSSKPVRNKHAPAYLLDYVCNSSFNSADRYCHSNASILYPISSFDSLSHLSKSHRVFTTSITHNVKPKNYKEACLSENWVKAMTSELEVLHKNKTWNIVDLPPHVKPIGSRWVYKAKHKADGIIDRYKARLVAKGYNQIEGLDFLTHSPLL
ncbi:uncharacterized mitochondrial protein AtMg00820-like [Vicia villosa]|uniref:uncharacterized mitochondrial protein AtMg00820-like n=1 Tax=Vicia villosa TaxID=3911 RepID=UPI00273C5BE4|nr:uncharacterized mitochondrial protein AtMg00820-like [Vicia villosa]